MRQILTLIIVTLLITNTSAQIVLEADGSGNTYELINSILAKPSKNALEVPDCGHTSFGRHIKEVFDSELNKNVFQFHLHVTPDNDRCKAGINDRQRNEIKTYSGSPENLIARNGETVQYKWKFRLSNNFKPSSSFTHIHQIKSVGGSNASIPMITFTPRKSNPDRLEIRYTPTRSQKTVAQAELDLFRGKWVSVSETITFADYGSYNLEIKDVTTGKTILKYTAKNEDLWQDGATFARPKWGIYRSLNNAQDLQDEIVSFADFSIEENPATLSVDVNIQDLKDKAANILLFPNPSSQEVAFKNANPSNYDSIEVYDYSGRKINVENKKMNNTLNVDGLAKGLYFIVFKKDTITAKVLKCYVK